MRVRSRRSLFQQDNSPNNPLRMMLWAVLIMAGLYVLRGVSTGDVQPLFLPTPTATRSVGSYRQEGAAFFEAGNLDLAIQAYQDALAVDASDYLGWAELARIQTYSSSSLTQERKRARLAEARESAENALALAPEESMAHAAHAFTLDWSAGAAGSQAERQAFLAQANTAAIRAVQLDSNNVLALAYLAEIYTDQQQYTQAFQYANLALDADPNSLDTRRVYAYLLESTGDYANAIDQYVLASEISPNQTFLYISIGQNFRQLGLYDQALEFFDRAASINSVLGINDPLPYVAIAKTYSRQGEFFAAAANARRAIEFDPTNPDLYGQLGIIYHRSRNFESAIEVLQCAVTGCDSTERCTALNLTNCDEVEAAISVEGLALDDATVLYYYTYGTVTASLELCSVSEPILDLLAVEYADDALVMSIVNESYVILSRVECK